MAFANITLKYKFVLLLNYWRKSSMITKHDNAFKKFVGLYEIKTNKTFYFLSFIFKSNLILFTAKKYIKIYIFQSKIT